MSTTQLLQGFYRGRVGVRFNYLDKKSQNLYLTHYTKANFTCKSEIKVNLEHLFDQPKQKY